MGRAEILKARFGNSQTVGPKGKSKVAQEV
jgi:hypothetical protein